MPSLETFALPATLAFLLVAMLIVLDGGDPTEVSLRQMIRITAASSTLLFSLAFSASSLDHLIGNRRWPARTEDMGVLG
jgi:hypothetical protein